jgi:hypothetical protein
MRGIGQRTKLCLPVLIPSPVQAHSLHPPAPTIMVDYYIRFLETGTRTDTDSGGGLHGTAAT